MVEVMSTIFNIILCGVQRKLLEILIYGEIQVRQVDDIMMMYMTFTIYAAYKAGMAVQAKKRSKPKKISQSPLIAKKENDYVSAAKHRLSVPNLYYDWPV